MFEPITQLPNSTAQALHFQTEYTKWHQIPGINVSVDKDPWITFFKNMTFIDLRNVSNVDAAKAATWKPPAWSAPLVDSLRLAGCQLADSLLMRLSAVMLMPSPDPLHAGIVRTFGGGENGENMWNLMWAPYIDPVTGTKSVPVPANAFIRFGAQKTNQQMLVKLV
jgi:hypothetical protein